MGIYLIDRLPIANTRASDRNGIVVRSILGSSGHGGSNIEEVWQNKVKRDGLQQNCHLTNDRMLRKRDVPRKGL